MNMRARNYGIFSIIITIASIIFYVDNHIINSPEKKLERLLENINNTYQKHNYSKNSSLKVEMCYMKYNDLDDGKIFLNVLKKDYEENYKSLFEKNDNLSIEYEKILNESYNTSFIFGSLKKRLLEKNKNHYLRLIKENKTSEFEQAFFCEFLNIYLRTHNKEFLSKLENKTEEEIENYLNFIFENKYFDKNKIKFENEIQKKYFILIILDKEEIEEASSNTKRILSIKRN